MNKLIIIKIFSFLVMAVSILVIIGWVFDIAILKSIYPTLVTMKFITAIAFLLSGFILYFIVKTREGWVIANETLPLLSVIIILLMVTLLVSTIFGIHTGIEDLFIRENVEAVNTIVPGSPAIPTMIAFILVAISGFLCFIDYGKFRKIFIVLGGTIAAIGSIAIVGYILSIPLLYYYIPDINGAIAVSTSILFIIIGISLVLLGKLKFEQAPIEENKKIFKTSIRFRILFSFLSIGLVSSLLLGYVSINSSENIMRDEISNKLLLLVEAKEGQVYAYLDSLKLRTLDFSSDGFIKDSLIEIKKNNLTETAKSLNLHLQAKKSLDQSIVGIMILDSEGKVIASTDEKEIGESESGDDYFIKGKTNVSFFEEREGNIHFGIINPFIVSAPIKDKDSGRFLGLIVNVFKTEKLSDILSGKYQIDAGAKTSELSRSKTLEIYLVNKNKKMFVNSYQIVKKKLKNDIETEVNTLPVKKCFENNKETSQVYQNYVKKEVLGASMCITQEGWTLIVEISTAEAFAPIQSMEFGLISFIIIILLFVVIYAFITGNKISRPIKVLQNAVEIISQGNLDYKIKISTGNEIEQLGNAFNVMAENVKESRLSLEEKVKEQTKELTEQLIEINKKNALAQDTKLAVLNILEDSNETTSELQKFKLAVETASEHIIITDPDGVILYANKAAEKTTGYPIDEIIGKRPSLWGGKMPKEFYENMWDTIKNKKTLFHGEVKNKKKNGEEYIADDSISPILDKESNIKFFVGIERDITKEKTFEDQLQKEKEGVEKKVIERTKELNEERIKLQSSISSLTVGFVMTDRENNIVIINQAARNILCASGTSLLLTVQECTLTHIEDELKGAIDLRALINQSISEKKPLSVKEISFRNRFLKIAITPIIEAEVIGVVVLIDDISEAKILERSRDEFFSIASHELRTPLTSIRGNTSIIMDYFGKQLKDPQMKEMIDDIHESSVRLINIVNDFLNVSRLEQGRLEFRKENIDLGELIKEVVEELEPSVLQRKIDLRIEKTVDKLPTIMADRDRVKEILINLISNSFKSIEKEGEVVVRVEKVDKSFLKVLVSDTGRGISLAQQSLLFRKFQQAGANLLTRDTTKGTGLGLYISKMMVEGMGGTIALENSVVDKRTTFSFTIPVAKKEV